MKRILLIILILSSQHVAQSATFSGGEITYQWLQDSSYQFTLKLYSECGATLAVPVANSLCYYNDCNSQSGHLYLTRVAAPSQQYWYQGNVTLNSRCGNWTFYSSIQGRDSSKNIKNDTSNNIYLEATLNNQFAQGNSSPVFSAPTTSFVAVNRPYTLNPGASDPNNDSLSFDLIQPRTAVAVTNAAGCQNMYAATEIPYQNVAFNNINNPFSSGQSFAFNPLSGQASFTAVDTGINTIAYRVNEWRNGVKIGSVVRDGQMRMHSFVYPGPIQSQIVYRVGISGSINTTPLYASVGTPFTLCVNAYFEHFLQGIVNITSNASLIMPGSVVTITQSRSDSVTICISYTPQMPDIGLLTLAYSVTDRTPTSCFYTPQGFQTYSLPIVVSRWPAQIGTVQQKEEISIYPNPAQTILNIQSAQPITTMVINSTGQQFIQSAESKIDVTRLADGVYFLLFYDGLGTLLKRDKLIKTGQ